MYFIFGKVKNRILESGSSWSDWYTVAIIAGVIVFLIFLVVLGSYLLERRSRKLSRMIDFNGKEVDSAKVVTVSLMGSTFEFVQLVKGDVFVAPLQEREGYDFAGWYYDSAFTKPYYNRSVKANITLYPKWVKHS